MLTVTTTLKAPVAGAGRYHSSTRRVSPASLCTPSLSRAVPFHLTLATVVAVEFVISMETPTTIRRFVVAAVVVCATVSAAVPPKPPVSSPAPEDTVSTATCAWSEVAANNSSRQRKPRMEDCLAEEIRPPDFPRTLPQTYCARAADRSIHPPTPRKLACITLRPTRTSLA